MTGAGSGGSVGICCERRTPPAAAVGSAAPLLIGGIVILSLGYGIPIDGIADGIPDGMPVGIPVGIPDGIEEKRLEDGPKRYAPAVPTDPIGGAADAEADAATPPPKDRRSSKSHASTI